MPSPPQASVAPPTAARTASHRSLLRPKSRGRVLTSAANGSVGGSSAANGGLTVATEGAVPPPRSPHPASSFRAPRSPRVLSPRPATAGGTGPPSPTKVTGSPVPGVARPDTTPAPSGRGQTHRGWSRVQKVVWDGETWASPSSGDGDSPTPSRATNLVRSGVASFVAAAMERRRRIARVTGEEVPDTPGSVVATAATQPGGSVSTGNKTGQRGPRSHAIGTGATGGASQVDGVDLRPVRMLHKNEDADGAVATELRRARHAAAVRAAAAAMKLKAAAEARHAELLAAEASPPPAGRGTPRPVTAPVSTSGE